MLFLTLLPWYILFRKSPNATVQILPITIEALNRIATLPLHHRDPFDRLLIAQAIVEDIPIVSRDGAFSNYPVQIIW